MFMYVTSDDSIHVHMFFEDISASGAPTTILTGHKMMPWNALSDSLRRNFLKREKKTLYDGGILLASEGRS